MNTPVTISLDSLHDQDVIAFLETLRGRNRSEYVREAIRLKMRVDKEGTLQGSGVRAILSETPVQALIPPKVTMALDQILSEVRALRKSIEVRPWPIEGQPTPLPLDELEVLERNLDDALSL